MRDDAGGATGKRNWLARADVKGCTMDYCAAYGDIARHETKLQRAEALAEALRDMATYLDSLVALKAAEGPSINARRDKARAALAAWESGK